MLKPLVFGDYPDEMKRTLGSRLPVFSEEESEQVKGSSDFVGIIHYTTVYVTNQPAPYIFPSSTNKDFFTDMGAYIICMPSLFSSLFNRFFFLKLSLIYKSSSLDSHWELFIIRGKVLQFCRNILTYVLMPKPFVLF